MVGGVDDAVDDGVAEVEVGGGHVDLGPEDFCPVGELAPAHPLEEIEVFFDGAVAVWAFAAWFGQGATVLADFLGAEVVHVFPALMSWTAH